MDTLERWTELPVAILVCVVGIIGNSTAVVFHSFKSTPSVKTFLVSGHSFYACLMSVALCFEFTLRLTTSAGSAGAHVSLCSLLLVLRHVTIINTLVLLVLIVINRCLNISFVALEHLLQVKHMGRKIIIGTSMYTVLFAGNVYGLIKLTKENIRRDGDVVIIGSLCACQRGALWSKSVAMLYFIDTSVPSIVVISIAVLYCFIVFNCTKIKRPHYILREHAISYIPTKSDVISINCRLTENEQAEEYNRQKRYCHERKINVTDVIVVGFSVILLATLAMVVHSTCILAIAFSNLNGHTLSSVANLTTWLFTLSSSASPCVLYVCNRQFRQFVKTIVTTFRRPPQIIP